MIYISHIFRATRKRRVVIQKYIGCLIMSGRLDTCVESYEHNQRNNRTERLEYIPRYTVLSP